jgi:hypothetical protein
MSKFLRTMTALSKKPSDFQKKAAPEAAPPVTPAPEALPKIEPQCESRTADETAGRDRKGVPFSILPPGPVSLSGLKKRLFRPLRPSDAHADGENRLYNYMWHNSQPHSTGVRVYTGSMTALAKAIGRDDRNTRPLVEGLLQKLSIQIVRQADSKAAQPRIYFVFDYSTIGARRKTAGLDWALKGKGIQLLTAQEAARQIEANLARTPTVDLTNLLLFTPGAITPGGISPVVSIKKGDGTGDDTAGGPGVVSSGPPPVVSSSPTLYGETKNRGTTTSSSASLGDRWELGPAPRAIAQALREETGYSDDDAVRRIAANCRRTASDATDDEIAHFVRDQARRHRRNPRIHNLIGLLTVEVPKCFEGQSFALYREEVRKQQEAERQRDLEIQAMWRKILEDPTASESDKQMARSVLYPQENN